MKTKHLGIEIDRRKDGSLALTEPFHFGPDWRDIRPMEIIFSHDADYLAYLANREGKMVPVFSDNCPDEEIVKWWLGSEERKRLTSEGAPA